MSLINVLNTREFENTRYKVKTKEYTIKIDPEDVYLYLSVLHWYIAVFQEVLDIVTVNCHADFKIGIKIGIPAENNCPPICIPFTTCGQLSGLVLANALEDVLQSNNKWESNVLIISATILHVRFGLGRGIPKYNIVIYIHIR